MIRVKICGITRLEDALIARDAGADAVGFVFAKSSRKVSPEKAREITSQLGPLISTVGVFVNEKTSTILRIAQKCKLSAVQLHGDETSQAVRALASGSLKVIKAFRVADHLNFDKIAKFPANALLLDTFSSGQYGGTGKTFDWAKLKKLKTSAPLIVSGGLRPDNVGQLLKICEPYGVDVSSGVEKSPGIKDPFLIRKFIENVKTR